MQLYDRKMSVICVRNKKKEKKIETISGWEFLHEKCQVNYKNEDEAFKSDINFYTRLVINFHNQLYF